MAGKAKRKGVEKSRATKPMNQHHELRKKLSDDLRSMYDSVLSEPLPDNMMAFLKRLDQEEDEPDEAAKKN